MKQKNIKFRAWIPSSKIMVNEAMIIGKSYFGEGSVMVDSEVQKGEALKGLIWMQYTGLKDKKGKEIYEGDLLIPSRYIKAKDNIHWKRTIVEVEFNKGMFCLKKNSFVGKLKPLYQSLDLGKKHLNEYEVMENIYEISNLLIKKQK